MPVVRGIARESDGLNVLRRDRVAVDEVPPGARPSRGAEMSWCGSWSGRTTGRTTGLCPFRNRGRAFVVCGVVWGSGLSRVRSNDCFDLGVRNVSCQAEGAGAGCSCDRCGGPVAADAAPGPPDPAERVGGAAARPARWPSPWPARRPWSVRPPRPSWPPSRRPCRATRLATPRCSSPSWLRSRAGDEHPTMSCWL
jgi:hypothetical protein